MTLTLKHGDYARDKSGNVYGPLGQKFFSDGTAILNTVIDGTGREWLRDGRPYRDSPSSPPLVAKVRKVETWEDVVEPVRETRTGAVEFFSDDNSERHVYANYCRLTFIDGEPDWSTLKVPQ